MRESWNRLPLRDVVEHTIGGVWGGESGTDEVEVTVVRSTEFTKHGFLNFETGVSRSIKKSQLQSRELKRGDILLEKSGGGPDQPVGRVVYVTAEIPNKLVCSNFVQLVRPDPKLIDPLFLFHIMWHWHSINRTLEFQAQTTGIRNLRTPDYLEQEINLPPLPEQKRIVDLIASIDSYIEALQQYLDRAKKSRNAVLHELFSSGGDDWVEEVLGEISEVTMGRQLSPSKKLGLRPRPYIRAANIGSWGISLEEIFEMDFTEVEEFKFSSKIGDTLLVEGGNEKSVGCPALVTKREEGLCIQNTVIRCRSKDSSKFDPNFQYHLLRFMFWRGDFAELCAGTTIMHLGQKRAEVVKVQLPPMAKQIEIVEIISTMDDVVVRTELALGQARNLRSGLLSDLLCGEHEIPASYDNIMSVA
jgi:type I restriction enzyme S subunit